MQSYKSIVVQPVVLEANSWGLIPLSIPYELLDLDLRLTPINPNIIFEGSDRFYRGVFKDNIVDLLVYNNSSIECKYDEDVTFSSIEIVNKKVEFDYRFANEEEVRQALEKIVVFLNKDT
jgi:hypothetical protein